MFTFVTVYYEIKKFTMINNEEFTKRLKKVIEFYGESASSFAEKIGVQRSSISHLLSGRNKPSLEFILKILSAYPEIDLYWLMNGKGNFPPGVKKEKASSTPAPHAEKKDLFSNSKSPNLETAKQIATTHSNTKEIERIVIFYKDGSFSNFENS